MTIKNVSNFDLFDTCAPLAVDYRATWHTFWLQPSKCFPKKILIFSPKKSTLKKILTFFLRRCLSYTLGNGTFLYFLEKRFFLIVWEIELSYIFPKKFFLYFRKWNFCALAPIFPNKIFLYFSLKKTLLKIFLYSLKNLFVLYFRKWNFLAPKIKKLLIFS